MTVKTDQISQQRHTHQHHKAPRPTIRQRFFAWLTARGETGNNRLFGHHKRRLFKDISGTVLEIGPGTGVNLAYYPAGIHWIGVEPNPAMHDHLRQKAEQVGITADFRLGAAEQLDLPDNSVDTVVSTLVLCSVIDPEATLQEILRVLKPGGRFIFLEHVAAPEGTGLRRLQNLAQPAWTTVADGCHPNRETSASLEKIGFERLDYTSWQQEGLVATPMIAGIATKRR